MKKWVSLLLALCLLSLSVMPCFAANAYYFYDGAYHEYNGNTFNLKINDKKITPPIPPIVFSDYSVVPARAVFEEGLGAKVEWESSTQKVTVTMEKIKLELFINKKTAYINGKAAEMPIAPKIINNYTMIPARFVGDQLGMEVEFDSTTDTIIINSPEKEVKQVSVNKVTTKKVNSSSLQISVTTNTEDFDYNIFTLKEPERLVIDILDGVFINVPSNIETVQGNVLGLRCGQQETSARIVVDLSENLGHTAKQSGKVLTITVKTDPKLVTPTQAPTAKPTQTPAPSQSPGSSPSASPSPTPTPTATPTPGVTKLVKYGYEGSQDYIKFSVEKGMAVKNGATITVPVSGKNLPAVSSEISVTGFFGKKIAYMPGKNTAEGTIIITLKSAENELVEQGNELRLKSVHKDLKRSVMLDAGHGGQDGGAVAYHEDGTILAMEKDFNLDVALRAQKILEEQGIEVHMIRTEDVYVDFLKVGGIANNAGSTLFVSVHTNATITDTASGIETFGYLDAGSVSNDMTSKRFSEIVLNELIAATGAKNRGVKDGKELAVINSTKMPATLVEIGFISNPEECAKMMTEEYRQILAEAICKGILKAFDEMKI